MLNELHCVNDIIIVDHRGLASFIFTTQDEYFGDEIVLNH